MLNLNQLRAFYETAKGGSFSQAAGKLCVSQPAVNTQVRLFERECGLKLFVKKGRLLHLTDEGRALCELAADLFEQERRIEELVDQMKGLRTGALRIGTARTYARHFMPYLIRGFHKVYPGIRINLEEGSSQEMLRSLTELKNNLAVVAWVEGYSGVRFLPFCREEVLLVLSPGHPLAGKGRVSAEDLQREPVIMKERGSGTRGLVDRLFQSLGTSPNILMESSDAEMMKLLVQHGEGMAFLVREAVSRELEAGGLVSLPYEGGPLELEVCIAHPTDTEPSPAATAFLGMLGRACGQYKAPGPLAGVKEGLPA